MWVKWPDEAIQGLKFFNLLQPDVAIFGQKDAMQCVVIARMLEDCACFFGATDWGCTSSLILALEDSHHIMKHFSECCCEKQMLRLEGSRGY